MSKKSKVILAVSITVSVAAITAAASVVVCKRIYEKKYFSAN